MAVIVRLAVYSPARAAADEDALTMMLEAARRTLAGGERPDRLALASLSLPYSRRVQAGLIAEALGLPRTTFCVECTTSARAATEAIRALGSGLVLAHGGSHAAGILLAERGGAGDAPLGRILAVQSALAEYPGLDFVPAGEEAPRDVKVPGYAEAAYLDLVREAARGLEADWLALNPPEGRLGRRAAAALGFREAAQPPSGAGAAGPLLALFAAMGAARPGDRILLVSYGAGSAADAILIEKGGT